MKYNREWHDKNWYWGAKPTIDDKFKHLLELAREYVKNEAEIESILAPLRDCPPLPTSPV